MWYDYDSKTRISEGNVASVEKYEMLYTKETEHYIELESTCTVNLKIKEWIKASLPEAVAEINRFINSKDSPSQQFKKYNPKKHQKDAIDAVVKEAKVNDKVSIVMPTGSGKTLTSLWITESLKAETVLFLAPSLQLIRQTKDAWAEQARVDFVWMACCPDDIDEREHAIEMGGGMVSTNPADIDGFVRFMNGKKVIFSTYQSLPSVLACNTEFDIVISDEAHRTAGMSKNDIGLFNLVHSKKLKSKLGFFKQLLQKYLNLLEIVDNEDDIAFDMNDEKLYGKIAYEMTLGEAIDKSFYVIIELLQSVKDEEVASHLEIEHT